MHKYQFLKADIKPWLKYLFVKKYGIPTTYADATLNTNMTNTLTTVLGKIKNFKLHAKLEQATTSISGGDEYDSPSPEHPQDIHTISGDNEVILQNKNLLPSIINWEKGDISTSGGGTDISGENYIRTKGLHKCKPNTNYYFTYDGNYKYSIYFFDNDKTFLGRLGNTQQALPRNFTTPENCYYYRIALRNEPSSSSIKTDEILVNKFQLELGTVATSYVEHQEQSLPLNLGDLEYCKIGNYEDEFVYNTTDKKNLFNLEKNDFKNGIMEGAGKKVYITLKPNTQYTLSSNEPNGTSTSSNIWFNGTSTSTAGVRLNVSRTTTTDSEGKLYIMIRETYIDTLFDNNYWIQLEEGSIATEPIPYPNGKWYLKKNIKKIVFDGNEDKWQSSGTNAYITLNDALGNNSLALSNYFKYTTTTNDQWGYMKFGATNKNLIFYQASAENVDLTGWENWLSTHNTVIDYLLATPEYILLNDTLQSQLNAIENTMRSYKSQTNITVETNIDTTFDLSYKTIDS